MISFIMYALLYNNVCDDMGCTMPELFSPSIMALQFVLQSV